MESELETLGNTLKEQQRIIDDLNRQLLQKLPESFRKTLQQKNTEIKTLQKSTTSLKLEIRNLRYQNFVSRQIIENFQFTEKNIKSHYQQKIRELRFKLKNVFQKVKELQLLKSIPLGSLGQVRYFLITNNVVAPNYYSNFLLKQNQKMKLLLSDSVAKLKDFNSQKQQIVKLREKIKILENRLNLNQNETIQFFNKNVEGNGSEPIKN